MMDATRYDRADLLAPVKTPEGYLLCEGIAVKPGVYPYLMHDGSIRREFKPPEELFAHDALASLGRKPVTLDHPWDAEGQQVTADNVDKYGVGDVDGEVEVVEGVNGYVRLKIAVRRADAVRSVETRQTPSLSLGMACKIDPTPGVWEGQPYDVVQRGFRYNHLALVTRGRVPSAVIRTDAAVQVADPPPPQEETMEKWTVGGKDYECPPELATALRADADERAEQIRNDEATYAAKLKQAKADKERMEGELDGLKATIADLEGKLKAKEEKDEKKSDSIDPALFAARLRLVKAAERMKIEGVETKTDSEIRRAIAEKAGATLENRADSYIEAFADIVIQRMDATGEAERLILDSITTPPADLAAKRAERQRAYLKSQGQEV